VDRPTCGSCPYWNPEDDGGEGYCHRRAPQPSPIEIMKYSPKDGDDCHWGSYSQAVVFPQTDWDDWCGDHPDFPAYLKSLKEGANPCT
jgi:hypothetical protein